MTSYPNIEYNQRPQSYWDDQDLLQTILRNVKGTQRREMIVAYWNAGRLAELDNELLKDTLGDESRAALSKIHPAFMGGEYLPDFDATEVEIARIELQSVTADVISIRAVRDGKLIRYRVVDEYETVFRQPFDTSYHPLTLRQIIRFIGRTTEPDIPGGLSIVYNNHNTATYTREELRYFTTITSQFYPQLREHFEHYYENWVRWGRPSAKAARGLK